MSKVKVCLSIDRDTHIMIKNKSKEEGRPISWYYEKGLKELLKQGK